MYLLDTNILSELMRTAPKEAVLRWLTSVKRPQLFTCVICEAEIRYGLERLPEGRKRKMLEEAAISVLSLFPPQHILPYQRGAISDYTNIRLCHEKAGRTISMADIIIAAITKTNGLTLVTRNSKDFEGLNLPVFNPFE